MNKNINKIKLLLEEPEEYIDFIMNNAIEYNKGHTENHHILPRSIFPEYANEDWNKVHLSLYNHFVAHYYLAKSLNRKMIYAFNNMNRLKDKFTPDQLDKAALMYAEFRQRFSEEMSKLNTGRKISDEAKQKMSLATMGTVVARNTVTGKNKRIPVEKLDGINWVSPQTGVKKSSETRQKMSRNGIKGKKAFTHKESGKIVYRDASFNNPNYMIGSPATGPKCTDRFTGTKHWEKDGETKRSVESPGPGWKNCRPKFNNVFSKNLSMVNILTGESEFFPREQRQPHHFSKTSIVVYNDDYIIKTEFKGIPRSKIIDHVRGIKINKTLDEYKFKIKNIKTFIYKGQIIL